MKEENNYDITKPINIIEPGTFNIRYENTYNYGNLYLDKSKYYFIGVNKKGNKIYLEKNWEKNWVSAQFWELDKNSGGELLYFNWENFKDQRKKDRFCCLPYETFKKYVENPVFKEEEFYIFYEFMNSYETLYNYEQLSTIGYSGFEEKVKKQCNLINKKTAKIIHNKDLPKLKRHLDKLFNKKCKA